MRELVLLHYPVRIQSRDVTSFTKLRERNLFFDCDLVGPRIERNGNSFRKIFQLCHSTHGSCILLIDETVRFASN